MKKKVLLIGGAATAVMLAAGWAFAQSGPHGPGAMGPGMMQHMARGMGPGMMQHMGPGMTRGAVGPAFADPTQLDALKSEIGITTAQEPAWSKYAKAVQAASATMTTTRESVDPEAVSKMAPADRFAFVSKMREQAQTQFDAMKSAADELLVTLDEVQKAKARDVLPGLAALGLGMRDAMAGPRHRH